MKIDDSYWYGYKDGKRDGYNKSIDDFAERMKYEIRNGSWQFSRLETETIDRIAEQMKKGSEEND